jgi:hypothetical protein
MDNERNTFAFNNTDLEDSTVLICADQHHDIAKIEHTDWIPIRVRHVLISDPVPTSTAQNHRIHTIKLT